MAEPVVNGTDAAAAKARVVAVVGASSGIGRAIALLSADAGDQLVLVARRQVLLERLAEEIGARRSPGATSGQSGPGRARRDPVVVVADAREEASGPRLVDAAVSAHGRLDVVVYAAGWNVPKRALGEATLESWQLIVSTNMTGAFLVTSAALPLMQRQGSGLFVFISSSGAKQADRSGAAYQASKAGLAALARATMAEAGEDGVRTTVVYPGMTDTAFLEHRPVPADAETRTKALKPDDVARAVRFVIDLPARAHIPELLIYPHVTKARLEPHTDQQRAEPR
jgi:NADP-dependent 3-hydroxy acid dehydrogenase YdfG